MILNRHDEVYLNLVNHVLHNGIKDGNRTEQEALRVISHEMRFDVSNGTIPLLTSKKMHTRSIIYELLWFLSGDTNVKYLQDNGVRIWNEWADENGDLGPVYGKQWRKWSHGKSLDDHTVKVEYIDQISNVIDGIKHNPKSRRHIVSAWNPGDISDMALPPCHCLFQFFVVGNKLSLKLTQRSADVFLGVPFNIAQYSMLLHMVAQVTGLQPGEFIWSGGDVHIYTNHIDQCNTQLCRNHHPEPKLQLNPDVTDIFSFNFTDINVIDYVSEDTLTGKVAV